MTTLKQNTQATFIHGITGKEVEYCTLAKGTEYTLEGINPFGRNDPETGEVQYGTILVEGYRYRVVAKDLE